MVIEPPHTFLVMVPAYNEAGSIGKVIADARRCLEDADLLVIDDGSTDSTALEAAKSGSILIQLPYNLGIGGAVQTGLKYAVQQCYATVVRMDGDGQHDPAAVASLVAPILAGEADVVIGSRYLGGKGYRAKGARAIGARIFAAAVSWIVGRRFTDSTSGFQAFNAAAAGYFAKHLPADYPEIEGLVMLCRSGFRVQEVPVTMRARSAGNSSITPSRSAYYAVKVLLAVLVQLLRRPIPKEV